MFRFEVFEISLGKALRGINKCRCDERLQTKTKEFTRLPYTEKAVSFPIQKKDRDEVYFQ
jgi:hypothetical protein